MRSLRFLTLAALLAAGPLVPGCTCAAAAREFRALPPVREACPKTAAPAGAPWESARVEVACATSTRQYSGRNFGSATYYGVDVRVVLAAPGRESRFRISGGESSDPAGAVEAAKADWKLSWSPDGRSLAASGDGGATWSVLVLDTGGEPFFCAHVPVKPSAGGDVWGAAPPAADIARGVWEEPGEGRRHRHGGTSDEWTGAAAWALARRDDPAPLAECVAALVRRGWTMPLENLGEANAGALRAAVAASPALRAACSDALRDPKAAWTLGWGNAAELLRACGDEEAQRALAAALAASLRDKQVSGAFHQDAQLSVARELARATESRRAAPAEVEAALAEAARAPNFAHELTAVWAVRALAALDTPGARAELARLADGVPDLEVPTWPAAFDDFAARVAEVSRRYENPAGSWARSALTAAGRK